MKVEAEKRIRTPKKKKKKKKKKKFGVLSASS